MFEIAELVMASEMVVVVNGAVLLLGVLSSGGGLVDADAIISWSVCSVL